MPPVLRGQKNQIMTKTPAKVQFFRHAFHGNTEVEDGGYLKKRTNNNNFADGTEIWCNGSTWDFGSSSRGSNPRIST